MKLSMYSYFSSMIRKQGIKAAVDFAVSRGFSSVELLELPSSKIPLNVPDIDTAKQLKAELDARGLCVSCYSVGLTVLDPVTGLPIPRKLEALDHIAEIASVLGSPYLHHTLILNVSPSLHRTYRSFESLLDALVEVSLPIAKKAESLGMTTLYEPQGFYVNGISQFGAFYERMKAAGARVGVCGDIGNSLFLDTDPTDFFKAFASEIRHVHLKDYQKSPNAQPNEVQSLGGTRLEQVLLGEGCVDFHTCLSLLQKIGYDGFFALEGSYSDVEAGYDADLLFLKKKFKLT